MNIARLLQKFEEKAPGAILENGRFGRSGLPAVWVETKAVLKVAEMLSADVDLSFDWLENLSVMQLEDALVANYFVRSHSSSDAIVLRASAEPATLEERIELPSVRSVWPMAQPFEEEIADLFGVSFLGPDGAVIPVRLGRLPKDWVGFPLRKGYIFPREVFGIQHSRQPDRPAETR